MHISELIVEDLRLAALPERTFRLTAHDLSTHPQLLEQPPRVALTSADGDLHLELGLASSAGGDGMGRVLFAWRRIPADLAAGALTRDGHAPFSGGTLDLVLDGHWSPAGVGHLDLPLEIVLHDTLLRLGSGEEAPVERLALAIALSGPIDDLSLHIDREALADALVQAGADALATALRARADEALEEAREEVRERTEEVVEEARDAVREHTQEVLNEAREELAEEAEELFDGLLKGRRGGLLDRIRERAPRGGGKRDIKKDKQDKEGRS